MSFHDDYHKTNNLGKAKMLEQIKSVRTCSNRCPCLGSDRGEPSCRLQFEQSNDGPLFHWKAYCMFGGSSGDVPSNARPKDGVCSKPKNRREMRMLWEKMHGDSFRKYTP